MIRAHSHCGQQPRRRALDRLRRVRPGLLRLFARRQSSTSCFFPEALPAPTFGSPGMLWASLTLALLTLPVVIVATEEGLSRIPRSIREGSLALGATKAETLWRTVLPMASPAMMTGLILAVARAAGEVAPLMLVGVVKLAPEPAAGWQLPVPAPGAQVHAPGLSYLRRRLPEPQRRSGAAAGVRHRACCW